MKRETVVEWEYVVVGMNASQWDCDLGVMIRTVSSTVGRGVPLARDKAQLWGR